jgi:hypothetical protein
MAELQRDTCPGELPSNAGPAGDWHGRGRRMSDHKIQALAESAYLKVLQYAVTAIALPVVGWSLSTVLDRLNRIDEAINRQTTNAATVELRLQQIERGNSDRDVALRLLTEKVVRHDYQLERVEEAQRPRGR